MTIMIYVFVIFNMQTFFSGNIGSTQMLDQEDLRKAEMIQRSSLSLDRYFCNKPMLEKSSCKPTRNGKYFIKMEYTSLEKYSLQIFETKSKQLKFQIDACERVVVYCSSKRNNNLLAYKKTDDTITILCLESGHEKIFYCSDYPLLFSFDSHYLLTQDSETKELHLWDIYSCLTHPWDSIQVFEPLATYQNDKIPWLRSDGVISALSKTDKNVRKLVSINEGSFDDIISVQYFEKDEKFLYSTITANKLSDYSFLDFDYLLIPSLSKQNIDIYNIRSCIIKTKLNVLLWNDYKWEIKEVISSPNGKYVCAYIDYTKKHEPQWNFSREPGKIKIWDLSKDNQEPVIINLYSKMFSLSYRKPSCIACDNRFLYVGGNSLEQYSLETGALVRTYNIGSVKKIYAIEHPSDICSHYIFVSLDDGSFVILEHLLSLSEEQLAMLVKFDENKAAWFQEDIELMSLADQATWSSIPDLFIQELKRDHWQDYYFMGFI